MKRHHKHSPHCTPLGLLWLIQFGLCIYTTAALAQSAPVATPAATTNVLPTITAPPQWNGLDPGQQQALYPLKDSWFELSDVQRRKWIAIVKNFPKLAPEDQAKVQKRMSAWAALKPIERERARENFANSKLIHPSTKTDSWEEYRALPQEEREKLASQTTKKRPSAAKNPKTPVPTSPSGAPTPPHALPTADERSNLRNLITPDTLLPRAW